MTSAIWFPHCKLSLYVKQYSISTSLRCLRIPGGYAHCFSNYSDLVLRAGNKTFTGNKTF